MAEFEATPEQRTDFPEIDPIDANSTQEGSETASVERDGTAERLCDPFLDRYATMMDHDNLASILAEQEHM